MAIPMLDTKSVWAKIKAGWSGGNKFRTVAPQPKHTFVDGLAPGVKDMLTNNSSPQLPTFGGGGKKK